MVKKDWVDWQKIAINHAKKGKPVPKIEDQIVKAEIKKVINDFEKVDKFALNWWGNPPPPAPKLAQPVALEQFFELPNPAKFIEEQEELIIEPPEPDPYNDNLKNVSNELQSIVDFAYANGEEPPLTLVRALNRIKLLEKNGDDWMAGYNVGWAEAGGQKQNPAYALNAADDDFDP